MNLHASNHMQLRACVQEIAHLRYTPAGIPLLDLLLNHQSVQTDFGVSRQVTLQIKAQAAGLLADVLVKHPLEQEAWFSGFLATGRNGRGLVLHIQQHQRIES